jgi:hypothetical protein
MNDIPPKTHPATVFCLDASFGAMSDITGIIALILGLGTLWQWFGQDAGEDGEGRLAWEEVTTWTLQRYKSSK